MTLLLSGCESLPQKVFIEKRNTETLVSEAINMVTPTPVPTKEVLIPIEMSTPVNNRNEEAVEAANHRLDTGWYTRESLLHALISDGFSEEEAEYGVDNCYIKWR